jgi:hypothetical protein
MYITAYPLRVLPQSFRTQDTSYGANIEINNSVYKSNIIDGIFSGIDTNDTKQGGYIDESFNSVHTDGNNDKNEDSIGYDKGQNLESNKELLKEMLSDTTWLETEGDFTDRLCAKKDRCVYIYIYSYIHVIVYVHVCIYMNKYTFIHIHINTYSYI